MAKGAKIKYIEKHYGEGEGTGDRILNPQTIINLDEMASMEMESVQIKGVTSTVRETYANMKKGSSLVISERIMTTGKQTAKTIFDVNLMEKIQAYTWHHAQLQKMIQCKNLFQM